METVPAQPYSLTQALAASPSHEGEGVCVQIWLVQESSVTTHWQSFVTHQYTTP